MELKTLKGYEPYIEPEKILDNLHKKYKNEDWILSKEDILKKRKSFFGNKIWKSESKDMINYISFGFESGIVWKSGGLEIFCDKGYSDNLKVRGRWSNNMKTHEILENIVLLKKSNKIMFKYDTYKEKGLTKIVKVSSKEIQFFDEFLRNCISESNNSIDKVKKTRNEDEQNINESRIKYESKKSEFLKKYDKDNNGTIDIIEGEDVFMKLFKKHQNTITETDKDYVHKFVKLSGYLKTKRKNIQQTFTSLKNNQFSDNSSSLTKLQRVKSLSMKKGISLIKSKEIVDNNGDVGSIDTIIELIENQIYFYNLVLFYESY